MENSEQPINPVPYLNACGTKQYDVHYGLTKREYFSSQAMKGHLSSPSECDINSSYILKSIRLPTNSQYIPNEHHPKYIAQLAVYHADALLAELALKENNNENQL